MTSCVLVGAEPRSDADKRLANETLLQKTYGRLDQLLTGNLPWRFRNDYESEV